MPRIHGREPGASYTDFRVPHRLGWLNYWCDELVRALGLVMMLRAGKLPAARIERKSHGWLVQVTDDEADLSRPDHQDAFRELYETAACVGFRRTASWR